MCGLHRVRGVGAGRSGHPARHGLRRDAQFHIRAAAEAAKDWTLLRDANTVRARTKTNVSPGGYCCTTTTVPSFAAGAYVSCIIRNSILLYHSWLFLLFFSWVCVDIRSPTVTRLLRFAGPKNVDLFRASFFLAFPLSRVFRVQPVVVFVVVVFIVVFCFFSCVGSIIGICPFCSHPSLAEVAVLARVF